MIDIEAIEARVKAETPVILEVLNKLARLTAAWADTRFQMAVVKAVCEITHAREDIPALIAEVKKQAAEIETLCSELYPAKEIEEQRVKRWEAEKRMLQKAREQLSSVTAERDAAVEDLISICENPNMFGCMMLLEKYRDRSGENG